ncbi:hypothetical protein MSMEI_4946 [Mycolicibacterium smegmatis MC2 155]|uniref:Uncharacterized protein n=1 Tax=Mycolicibacterium smegmatis (strain ATCC 700084 / mc(2)155) TaxID=246196 RepID=I7FJ97_MYCS2|nr:hypothetical protein MSMEI_4946 [Mycolicibacterium smegmatis MC2 155]
MKISLVFAGEKPYGRVSQRKFSLLIYLPHRHGELYPAWNTTTVAPAKCVPGTTAL